jgi:hypothetical protein
VTKCSLRRATAIDNILVQTWGAGVIASLEQLRGIVHQSFPVTEYKPQDVLGWERGFAINKKSTPHRESYAD